MTWNDETLMCEVEEEQPPDSTHILFLAPRKVRETEVENPDISHTAAEQNACESGARYRRSFRGRHPKKPPVGRTALSR